MVADMNSERLAFLEAIRVHPAEDTPRLVYADWLDEQAVVVTCKKCRGTGSHALDPYALAQRFGTYNAGKMLDAAKCESCGSTGSAPDGNAARAEFIRVQCELAAHSQQVEWLRQMPVEQWCGDDEERKLLRHLDPLVRRERELLTSHAFDWFTLPDCATYTSKVGGQFEGWCYKQSGQPGVDILAFTRRGFVDEAHLATRLFLGGPCLEPSQGFLVHKRCGKCDRTGRTPGLAKELFARHPITKVVLTDKTPMKREGAEEYFWGVEAGGTGRWGLPREVFATLPHSYARYVRPSVHYYECEKHAQDALDALSDMLVALGRESAGLPPL